MAISAQYFDVVPVGFPIGKPTRPTILALFGRKLFTSIYVIQVQYANIVIAALYTFPAQLLNQFKLALPRSALLLKFITIQIPESLLTFWCAKLCLRRFTALVASAALSPSASVITSMRAILSLTYSVGMDIEQRTTIGARDFYAGRLPIGGDTLKPFIPRSSTGKRIATLRPATTRTINLFLAGLKLDVTRWAYVFVHSLYFTINKEIAKGSIARARIENAAEQARQLEMAI